MRSLILGAALGLLTLILGIGPATAHSGLASSDPEDGARVQTLPATITFAFTENVGNAFIAVTAPDGTPVRTSEVKAVDREASTTLTDPDQRGTFTASFRVVSADGHPVAGSITFTVLTGEKVAQVAAEPASQQQGFLDRHLGHVLWGTAAGVAAIGLIVLPLRRRDDSPDT